jgi:hypothetical protein
LEYCGCDNPEDQADDELQDWLAIVPPHRPWKAAYPTDSEQSVVSANLLSTAMSTSAVSSKNNDAGSERDASHRENEDLGPGVGAVGPGRHLALIGKSLGCVENSERC